VLNITFPLNLTSPDSIPTHDDDPVFYPAPLVNLTNTTSEGLVAAALTEITLIAANDSEQATNCSKCIAALSIGQLVAQLAPSYLPDAMVKLCQETGFASNSSCKTTYEAGSFGAVWTQILAKADVTGLDGQYICNSLSKTFCPAPPVMSVKAKFPKPKPENCKPPKRSGKRLKVLHLSDLHLGLSYMI